MARKAVQFQGGLSEAEFDGFYGTEEQCRAMVIKLRWPTGFSCPVCVKTPHSVHTSHGLFQCKRRRRQTPPTAETIFAATKLPLHTGFRAMYHMTQSKQGISSIALGRCLGVRQTSAWMLKPKLQQAMMERDRRKRLKGRVEIDDAVLGGQRSGGKQGRCAPDKTPFVTAVETSEVGKPVRLKLRRVAGFTGQTISRFALRSLDPACTVVSDGLACFHRVTDAGCAHETIITGGGVEAACHPMFRWISTTLGNIKSAIVGTYWTISSKHAPRYLAEFENRYNRRYDLASMIPRLGYAAVHTQPRPYRLMKLAEVYG
jgi:hypothetical protein